MDNCQLVDFLGGGGGGGTFLKRGGEHERAIDKINQPLCALSHVI